MRLVVVELHLWYPHRTTCREESSLSWGKFGVINKKGLEEISFKLIIALSLTNSVS